MNTAICIVLAGLASGATAQRWYNGDPDNVNGLSAEFNTTVSDAFVFDNFNHYSGIVSAAWGNFYISTDVQGCMYQLRSGVSNGFGGTLHAGGEVDDGWEMRRNGFNNYGFLGYTIAVHFPEIRLPTGEYWLALSPIGDGTGRVFAQTTSGDNAEGTPFNDDNSFFYSVYFGSNYGRAGDQLGINPCDFSYGVGWWYPPAPPSLALLAFAGLASRRRR
jgi:hypothetical protein